MGRPCKPTALKLLKGTLRNSRQNPNEPKPNCVRIAPSPSYNLGKYGLKEWRRVTNVLIDAKILSEADFSLLEAYCYQYGLMREAQSILGEEGILIKSKRGGARTHPCLKIQNDAYDRMLKIGIIFGLGPGVRNKISLPESKAKSALELI